MARLDEFENPVSGKRDRLTDIGNWWGMILGAGVLIIVWRLSNQLVNMVGRFVPFGGLLGGPAAVSTKPASTAPTNTAPFAHVQ